VDFPDLPPPELVLRNSENVDGEIVVRTSLSLALTGTLIYAAKTSFAFISKKNNLQNYVIFGIGDCFGANTSHHDVECTKDSVKILEFKDRWVLLLHNGKKPALRMRNTLPAEKIANVLEDSNNVREDTSNLLETSALVVSPKKKSTSENTRISSTTLKSENTFLFERVWVDDQLADFGQLLSDARVIPTKKDGQSFFMFQYLK
jgi:hypothetical protein